MNPEYVDSNATSRLDERVYEEMSRWFLGPPSNAGSRTHTFGQNAKKGVETARKRIAEPLRRKPEEVIFTSGATEANNLAILGLERYGRENNRTHIISTAIEHKAVLEPLLEMRRRGFEVEFLPVSEAGAVDSSQIAEKLRSDTLLVSVMHANNETGVLQPIEEIGDILRGTPTLFHTDAAQTFGKEIESLRNARCQFISVSGHKIHGPQGVGALFIRRLEGGTCPLNPIVFGGGQERGLRPGTLPVALIAGFGKAAELAQKEHEERSHSCLSLKQSLVKCLETVEHQINGDPERSQNHVLNVRFCGVDGEALILSLQDTLAFSNGSACTSSSYEPSHVLKAMGFDNQRVAESVRFSWDHNTKSLPFKPILNAVAKIKM